MGPQAHRRSSRQWHQYRLPEKEKRIKPKKSPTSSVAATAAIGHKKFAKERDKQRKRGNISAISTAAEVEADDDLENENSNSEVEQNDRKKKIKKVDTEVENTSGNASIFASE